MSVQWAKVRHADVDTVFLYCKPLIDSSTKYSILTEETERAGPLLALRGCPRPLIP